MANRQNFGRAAAIAAALTLGATGAIAGGPAVSSPNLSVDGFGGIQSIGGGSQGMGGISATVTMPVGETMGFQVDGAMARIGAGDFYDVGGHLFWRDATHGMFGFYASHAHLSTGIGPFVSRSGIEAERYMGNLTLSGAVGHARRHIDSTVYGNAKYAYYWSPNFVTSGGFTWEGKGFWSSRAEYQFRSDGHTAMSVFYTSNWSASDTYQLYAGLKFSLSAEGEMNLLERDRQQAVGPYTSTDILGVSLP